FRFTPRFQLFQRPDHLRFRVPGSRHSLFPFPSLKSYSALCEIRGAGHAKYTSFKALPHAVVISITDKTLVRALNLNRNFFRLPEEPCWLRRNTP
ncbi:MAG TPA: hypothetical protein VF133_15825, partial [Terriglobales bacterium]